ncbi:Ff.00g100770.m01.CDS01 [Fusarium sp. VM40]|nr:Ff.00g100770.m01.CDS01 [Fusarium sp. VM40]
MSSAILDKLHRPWQSQHPSSSNSPSIHHQESPKLPSFESVERIAMAFCSSMQFLVFPVLSLDRFVKQTLPLAYAEGNGNQHGVRSAKACVYGLIFTSDIFGHNNDRDMSEAVSACESYALELEDSIPMILREMTADGLEALSMLIIYKYFMGDLQSAAFLVPMTMRLIFRLGAHVPPQTTEPYNKNNLAHHLRDLFWVCYCIDKDLTHRINQPPAINDNHCNLVLPANYAQMQSSNILTSNGSSNHNSSTVPLYPWDLRLSKMKSRIYEDLYSMSALTQPEAEVLRRIRCLDEELEMWRLTLPIDHRPTLSFLEQTPVDAHTNTQAIMLRLSYHHCITLIHKARCRIFGMNLSPSIMPDDGDAANFQLLVDASKSTLTYLEKALPALAHECFWIIIFYPMTAIVTIFSVALSNTKTSPVLRDLERLEDFVQVIRQIPIRKLTVAEITHLDFIEELVLEMSRLVLGATHQPGWKPMRLEELGAMQFD